MAGEGRVGWTGGVCQRCSEETSGYREWEMGGGGDLLLTVGGGWRQWLGWGVVADGKAGGGGR